jgi:hypothetical protein
MYDYAARQGLGRGSCVCDKVFSLRLGVSQRSVGASLRHNAVHRETLPLARPGIRVALFKVGT